MWWGWHHGFFPFGIFFLLLFGLLLFRCFGFWGWSSGRCGYRRGDAYEAEAVLQRRLASGEITIEEYHRLKEALRK